MQQRRASKTGVFEHFQERFDAAQEEELSLQDYLELCKREPASYATASQASS
jgi:serine protein kinase